MLIYWLVRSPCKNLKSYDNSSGVLSRRQERGEREEEEEKIMPSIMVTPSAIVPLVLVTNYDHYHDLFDIQALAAYLWGQEMRKSKIKIWFLKWKHLI